MLTNKEIAKTLSDSNNAKFVAALFIIGVVLQVLLAAINKTCMWICYYCEENEEAEGCWWSSFAYTISNQFWIDLLLDLGTVIAFTVATWHLFNIFLK